MRSNWIGEMSANMGKGMFPDIILKRENFEEWNQFIRRKLNEVPMMVDWIQGNQDAEMNFSVILFQKRVVRLCQVPEPGTGRLWTKRSKSGILIRLIWVKDQLLPRWSIRE